MVSNLKSRFKKIVVFGRHFFDYLENRKRIILIYQLGKVGSSTVYASLKKNLPFNEIYHVHFLSDNWLNNKLPSLEEYFHGNITIGKNIIKRIVQNPDKRIKIITLVREPVERDISDIFENWKPRYGNEKPEDVGVQRLIEDFKESDFEYTLSWFDSEFKNYTGIDIYSLPFDKEIGYSIYSFTDFDLLCIKMERLNDCYKEAFKKFLGLKINKLCQANLSRDKGPYQRYNDLKNRVKFDNEKLRKIYNEQYVQHFYTSKEIEQFLNRWS